jgi:hypothetical protein
MRTILKILFVTNILFTHSMMLLIINRLDVTIMQSWLIVTVFFYIPVLALGITYYSWLLLTDRVNLRALKYDILLVILMIMQSTTLLFSI